MINIHLFILIYIDHSNPNPNTHSKPLTSRDSSKQHSLLFDPGHMSTIKPVLWRCSENLSQQATSRVSTIYPFLVRRFLGTCLRKVTICELGVCIHVPVMTSVYKLMYALMKDMYRYLKTSHSQWEK